MAKYSVTFSCGHTEIVNLIGKVNDRERKIEWFEKHGLCSECWEAERKRQYEEQAKKAAEEAQELGLPELEGTEKQVAWANTLRQQFIENCEEFISSQERLLSRNRFRDNPEEREKLETAIAGMKKAIDTRLLSETSARFWIDNRFEDIRHFLAEAGDNALKAPQVEVPVEIQKQVLEEMTIRPSEPITNLVTEIRIKDDLVTAQYPERNEEFRQLLRGLRFSWENGSWQRKTNEATGTPLDRAAELGIKLLSAGFPIRVYNEDLQKQILSEQYEPECDRWVFIHNDGFRIWWDRKTEDFYDEARKLPGSRWISEKRSVYVPAEAFRELQDFAGRYQFRFSAKAQARLIEAAQAFEAAMVADIKAPEKESLSQPGSRPVLSAEQVSGEIDESLRDEN